MLGNRYLLKRRTNGQLLQQKEEILSKNIRLTRLLQENDWLFREIHHRVKNNLQVVMSLLHSQKAYLKDPAALHAMAESGHRVRAMSLIHQKLYKSTEMSSVDMQEYIQELVEYLRDSFDNERKVKLEPEIAQIKLDVSQAVPVGLILNEVMINSYKYSFPNNGEDRIVLRLGAEPNGEIRLSIGDNGKGLPADAGVVSNGNLGLSLIHGLSADLGATLEINHSGGTTYTLRFRVLLPLERSLMTDAASRNNAGSFSI